MARTLSCLPLALLFLASAVPSYGQKAGAGGGAESEVAVEAGAPLVLECPLRVEQRAQWRREGSAPPPDLQPSEVPAAGFGGGVTARLAAARAMPHHAGTYTCALTEPQHRIRVRLLSAAGTESAVTTTTETEGAGGERGGGGLQLEGELVEYEVRWRNLTLDCRDLYKPGEKIEWMKNESAIDSWADMKGRFVQDGGLLKLAEGERSAETDWGQYRCRSPAGQSKLFQVRGMPHAKLPADTSVVEGQKLKLSCKVTGMPYPRVEWDYSPTSDTWENATSVIEALGKRAYTRDFDRGNSLVVPNGELIVEQAERSDAGWYRCRPAGSHTAKQEAVTRLRVKDMYAALWPFLGICAEVFVLCAIILIYERRRTKPELDDSDTDNHDQKKS